MCRLLYQLLVLLEDLLQLLVLLHEGLVLDAGPLLLHLLPLGRCSLELLQTGRFLWVLRGDFGRLLWRRWRRRLLFLFRQRRRRSIFGRF